MVRTLYVDAATIAELDALFQAVSGSGNRVCACATRWSSNAPPERALHKVRPVDSIKYLESRAL